MEKNNKILYSISVDDVQGVAQEELGRVLSGKELDIVESKVGDNIDWFEAIALTIKNHIGRKV